MIISYKSANIALLKIKNFIRDIRQDNIILKVINIHKLNYLIENKQSINILSNNNKTLKILVCK